MKDKKLKNDVTSLIKETDLINSLEKDLPLLQKRLLFVVENLESVLGYDYPIVEHFQFCKELKLIKKALKFYKKKDMMKKIKLPSPPEPPKKRIIEEDVTSLIKIQ